MATAALKFLRDGLVFAVLGGAVGALTAMLSVAVDAAAEAFAAYPQLGWLLPVAGLATYGFYRATGVDFAWSTASVAKAARNGEEVPLRLVPAVVVGTVLTVLCGGSVGKEAAALQMAAGASGSFRRQLSAEGRLWAAPAAMGAALGAMLGVPAAGVVFSFEVLRRRPLDGGAVVAPTIAAAAAWIVTEACGVRFLPQVAEFLSGEWACLAAMAHSGFETGDLGFSGAAMALVVPVLFVGAISGAVGAGFCRAVSMLRCGLARLGAPVFALAVGGVAVSLLLGYAEVLGYGGVRVYCGPGADLAAVAVEGGVLPWWSFALKGALTLLTFAGGFKGGEIMPVLAVGACLGNAIGVLAVGACGIVFSGQGLAAVVAGAPSAVIALFSAVGVASFFSSCTKCPLTACVLSLGLFGPEVAVLAAPAAFLSSLCAPRVGLYPTALSSDSDR